jgi:hypothetical protein
MLPQWPPWQTEENIIYCSQASWLVEDDNQKKREREREREKERCWLAIRQNSTFLAAAESEDETMIRTSQIFG